MLRRGDDEHLAAGHFGYDARPFQLHNGLAQAERREQGTAAAAQRPQHAVALVGIQGGGNLIGLYIQPYQRGDVDLLFQKFLIGHGVPPSFCRSFPAFL